MTDPLFWLVLSFLFVTVSLTIVLAVAIPALKELARAARSAEKLFDTLRREFPPTLEAIRLTGLEISDLTDDVSEGVQSAGQVVKQVDQSLSTVRKQAQKVQSGTRSLLVGMKAAWRSFTRPQKPAPRRSVDRLPPGRPDMELGTGDAFTEDQTSARRIRSEPTSTGKRDSNSIDSDLSTSNVESPHYPSVNTDDSHSASAGTPTYREFNADWREPAPILDTGIDQQE